MTARPILMSQAMVRALLSNSKTQTRRILKPQPLPAVARWVMEDHWWMPKAISDAVKQQFVTTWPNAIRCPYGQPGSFLWVREATEIDNDTSESVTLARYTADGAPVVYPGPERDERGEDAHGGSIAHWWYSKDACPSIYMPRWASRLTLELTEVRVERLWDISEVNCLAEGCPECEDCASRCGRWGRGAIDNPLSNAAGGRPWSSCHGICDGKTEKEWYASLWGSINGPGSWAENPWVWKLSFVVHQQNVDALLKERVA